MIKKAIGIVCVLSIISLFIGSGHALAQNLTATNPNLTAAPCTPSPCPSSSQPAPDFKLNIKLNNPLKVNNIQDAIKLFMNTIVKIAIPFIIVFFIWSGLSFILARGNPEALKKARAMFLSTLIGSLLILGAWTITNAVVGTINSLATDSQSGK